MSSSDSTRQLLEVVLAQLPNQQLAENTRNSPITSNFYPSIANTNRTSTDTVIAVHSSSLDSSSTPTQNNTQKDTESLTSHSKNPLDSSSSATDESSDNTSQTTFNSDSSNSHDSSPSLPSNRDSSSTHDFSDVATLSQNDRQSFSNDVAIQLNDRGLASLPIELVDVMTCTVSKLSLQANQLTTLPMQIRQMKVLTYLDISHNNFTEFPSVVCSLFS